MAAMTAREFNQYTGQAKILAREEPLFITERGVVQYVLLSIDDYLILKGARRTLADLAMQDAEDCSSCDLDDFIPSRTEWAEREVDFS
ncbi:MAG: type II toxin-antitoxin system Phd/YefM family antitoxin [Coriobacteriia bacterium]|nr:type II toxin-antitoxin system Phd/YefM family antitoxin [Coriobacteriia bacterium]